MVSVLRYVLKYSIQMLLDPFLCSNCSEFKINFFLINNIMEASYSIRQAYLDADV